MIYGFSLSPVIGLGVCGPGSDRSGSFWTVPQHQPGFWTGCCHGVSCWREDLGYERWWHQNLWNAFQLLFSSHILLFWSVSGAHMNGAVSFTMCVFRRLPWKMLPLYISAQLLGSFLAAGTIYAVYYGEETQQYVLKKTRYLGHFKVQEERRKVSGNKPMHDFNLKLIWCFSASTHLEHIMKRPTMLYYTIMCPKLQT